MTAYSRHRGSGIFSRRAVQKIPIIPEIQARFLSPADRPDLHDDEIRVLEESRNRLVA